MTIFSQGQFKDKVCLNFDDNCEKMSEDGTTCRLTVLAAADALDKVGNKAARGQIAAAKVWHD